MGLAIQQQLRPLLDGASRLVDVDSLSIGDIISDGFYDEALRTGCSRWGCCSHTTRTSWETTLATITSIWSVEPAYVSQVRSDNGVLGRQQAMWITEHGLLVISHIGSSSYWCAVAAHTDEFIEKTLSDLTGLFPEIPQSNDPRTVAMRTVWSTPQGPAYQYKTITLSPWEEIAINYPQATRTNLDSVMNMYKPPVGGKLILLHGDPGTGKTFSIRALAKAWESWCSMTYVIDPETFFGSASYMAQVLASGNPEGSGHWCLLVLEDSDEYITGDAKRRTGQSLSRLLNLADGIMGQGLNILVLITTNEPVEKIHPAVSRPGRCLASIGFNAFSPEEAQLWLQTHGCTDRPRGKDLSLASLYDQVHPTHVEVPIESKPHGIYL